MESYTSNAYIVLGYFFPRLKLCTNWFSQWMGWAIFWATLYQAHLVTLFPSNPYSSSLAMLHCLVRLLLYPDKRAIFNSDSEEFCPGTDVLITIFCDFWQFPKRKMAFFLKTNFMIKLLHNLALFCVKSAHFFRWIFRRKYLKNHNIGPVSVVLQVKFLARCLQRFVKRN
jgi:hypothetical protein